MLDNGTKVRVNERGMFTPDVWGLPAAPKGVVVDHVNGFNAVHFVLAEDPQGVAKGLADSPGWLFTDDELDVL